MGWVPLEVDEVLGLILPVEGPQDRSVGNGLYPWGVVGKRLNHQIVPSTGASVSVTRLRSHEGNRMAEWSVKVFGPKHQIEAAVESLSSGSDWAITQSGDEWYMRSSQHPVVGNGRLVVDEAELEIDRINLVYGLFNPSDRALLTIGAHSFVREDGTQGHFLQVTTSSPIEHGLTTRQNVDGKQVSHVQWTPYAASAMRMPYAVARRKLSDDPLLQAAARSFRNRPYDWTRIEAVLELIEIKCGGKIPRGWVSKKKRELLRRTANSTAEAGGTGRHARPHYLPPPKPMPLKEARQIADHVLSEWLKSA